MPTRTSSSSSLSFVLVVVLVLVLDKILNHEDEHKRDDQSPIKLRRGRLRSAASEVKKFQTMEIAK